MNTEELLKPRYKVIADYPNAGTANYVGKTYTLDSEDQKEYFDKYPDIFKPLQWWEERKESDMPQYVRRGRYVVKVDKYFPDDDYGFDVQVVTKDRDIFGQVIPVTWFVPATEQEYLTQKQPQ